MLNIINFKNRLLDWVFSAVGWIFQGHAVDEARFTFVEFLREEAGGPEPEDFGMVYRDKTSGKEYLVDYIFAPLEGKDHFALFSIKEIVSRPLNEHYFDKETFKKEVVLKSADPDVENDMVAFFQTNSEKKGRVFIDKRKRQTTSDETGQLVYSAKTFG